MSKRADLYTGRAGHLAVMAELLMRGWNTAIPEVDIGDDIFVVQDSNGDLKRVQVKTAKAKPRKSGGYNARFNLSIVQLRSPITPDVIYIFAIRVEDRWETFVIVGRRVLHAEHSTYTIGYERKGRLTLNMVFEDNKVLCRGREITQYKGDWSDFPVIQH